jgi:spore coat protein A
LSRFSRRTFLERAAAVTLLAGSRRSFGLLTGPVQENNKKQPSHITPEAQLNALALPAFVDPLPLPEIIRPSSGRLAVTMRETSASFHRDLPPAKIWTYAAAQDRHHAISSHPLSPVIELRTGHPAEIRWINQLPERHLFAIDYSLPGCGHKIPDVRAVVHMHGARVPSKDDGYPEDWFVSGQSRVCRYPLQQDATALWYHDHAMGINRLNIYAGLAGMVLLRDPAEESLSLPRGAHEVPLILYDRMLTRSGQLLYPTSGIPDHPWIPEFSGDALCVNGKVRPFFNVEPTLYRFRILNAANSRFYALSLAGQKTFYQIGSDQGLLSAPVAMQRLIFAPGERADLLVDFSALAGQKISLQTGMQPMLEFRVSSRPTSLSPSPQMPKTLRSINRTDSAAAVTTRRITLNEYEDKTGQPAVMLLNRKHWHDPVTESVRLNTTEVWEFVNLTNDTHPMHLHMVRFQILDRRSFARFDFLMYGNMRYTADPEIPPSHELGWKDVVQCPGGMVTRIIVRFEGYSGRYLYHCHILEHEANDMMRPFDVSMAGD